MKLLELIAGFTRVNPKLTRRCRLGLTLHRRVGFGWVGGWSAGRVCVGGVFSRPSVPSAKRPYTRVVLILLLVCVVC